MTVGHVARPVKSTNCADAAEWRPSCTKKELEPRLSIDAKAGPWLAVRRYLKNSSLMAGF